MQKFEPFAMNSSIFHLPEKLFFIMFSKKQTWFWALAGREYRRFTISPYVKLSVQLSAKR